MALGLGENGLGGAAVKNQGGDRTAPIYIYIERERDTYTYVCIYIYIYIHIHDPTMFSARRLERDVFVGKGMGGESMFLKCATGVHKEVCKCTSGIVSSMNDKRACNLLRSFSSNMKLLNYNNA